MKVLVTGGTGFLGRHLVRALCAAEHEVRVLVRSEALSLERVGAQLVTGDVLEPETLADAVEGVEAVYHLAGRVQHKGEPTGLYQLHVEGTRNMLAAATAAEVGRFIHMSTSGTIAVSRDPARIAREDAPYALEAARHWPYYLSKIYAERVAFDAHERGEIPVVVLNPSLLLGPDDENLSSTEVIRRFLRREVPAVPPGGMNFVDVRDVAAASVAALSKGRPGARYLLGGSNITIDAFFVLLAKVSGIPAPGLKAGKSLNDWTARAISTLEDVGGLAGDESVAYAMAGHYWYLDAAQASAELGFKARSGEVTLRDTVTWLRSRGPLTSPRGTFGSLFRGVQRALGRA